ncbi:MAG TPA: hypothetical protein VH475_13790, partial [Tepidisphaeraceae bacterium]
MPLKGKGKVKTQLDQLIEKLGSHPDDQPWDWNDCRCARCLKPKRYFPHAWCEACHPLVLAELKAQVNKPALCVGAGIDLGWEYYEPLKSLLREARPRQPERRAKHIRG